MLAIEINGTSYKNFISATVTATIAAMARGFSFVSTASNDNSFPVKVGDQVVITADGTQIIDGYIESLEINYNDLMHDIRVSGRSFLADFVDSTAPAIEKSGTTLQAIATTMLTEMGIDATVDNQAGVIESFKKEISSAEPGQNALEFLESYSRKRQVLLTSDGGRKLVFARTGTEYAPIALKNVRGAKDNNIIDATRNIDYSNRFYEYTVKSQLNTSSLDFLSPPREVADQQGKSIDGQLKSRQGRKIVLNAEESSESFTAGQRAEWERNIRIGNSETYTATVVGNSVDGKLWLPNTIVKIVDEFCQLNSEMLIRDVQYDFDLNRGSQTRLTMITKDSIRLDVEQTARKYNVVNESNDFLSSLVAKIKL